MKLQVLTMLNIVIVKIISFYYVGCGNCQWNELGALEWIEFGLFQLVEQMYSHDIIDFIYVYDVD